MKFYFLLPLLLLLSCSNEKQEQPAVPVEMQQQFIADSSKQRLLNIIEGGWVNEDYVNAFGRFHSPMACGTYGLPLQQMAFDVSHLDGDTLMNAKGRLNYNEGQRFDVVFYRKANGSTGMWIKEDKNFYASPILLNYSIEGKDTVLLFTLTEDRETRTFRLHRQFRQFPETDDVPTTALEYFVNRELLGGKWNLRGDTVTFLPDGRVKNFKTYKRYAVSTVVEYPGSRPDEISFYNDTAGVTYVFTIDHDKLSLYEERESPDGNTFSRGKLAVELEKK